MCKAKDDLEDIASTLQRLQLQLNGDAQKEAEEIDSQIKSIEKTLDILRETKRRCINLMMFPILR